MKAPLSVLRGATGFHAGGAKPLPFLLSCQGNPLMEMFPCLRKLIVHCCPGDHRSWQGQLLFASYRVSFFLLKTTLLGNRNSGHPHSSKHNETLVVLDSDSRVDPLPSSLCFLTESHKTKKNVESVAFSAAAAPGFPVTHKGRQVKVWGSSDSRHEMMLLIMYSHRMKQLF